MAADAVQGSHLDLATLSDKTVSALSAQLPSFATATNPIDVTAALLSDSQLLGRILGILSDDPAFDLLLVALPVAGAGYDVPAFAKAASDFAARTGKPAIVAAPQENVAARFHDVASRRSPISPRRSRCSPNSCNMRGSCGGRPRRA